MAWIIGDSFDFYSTIADAGTHWDTAANANLVSPGRFTGSQAMGASTLALVQLVKTSGSNDATHHLVCAFIQTVALSSTVLGQYFQLMDGATGQCCIVFRSDGVILLTSGTPAGTVLATYNAAFSANVWTAFEFEVTINNTTGVFKARKDGATSDSFSATGLNTRGGTANNYANKLQIGKQTNSTPLNANNTQEMDDVLWFSTSGAAPNTWVGDIRAVQLMPVSDASIQFSRIPWTVTPFAGSNTASKGSGQGLMTPFTAPYTGTISTLTVNLNAGGTGNLKAAIYDATRTTVLATSNAVVNPVNGVNTITFGTPLSVTQGTVYNVAFDTDFTIVYTVTAAGSGFQFTTAYASFPAASPALIATGAPIIVVNLSATVSAQFVNDVLQDGLTTYVYDSVVGHADLYNVADLPSVPASIVGLVTRGYVAKSDAGAKSAQLQLKSGATTVQSTTLVLSTSFVYTSRVDTTDPNTSAAWTAAAVNAIQIGPYVTA